MISFTCKQRLPVTDEKNLISVTRANDLDSYAPIFHAVDSGREQRRRVKLTFVQDRADISSAPSLGFASLRLDDKGTRRPNRATVLPKKELRIRSVLAFIGSPITCVCCFGSSTNLPPCATRKTSPKRRRAHLTPEERGSKTADAQARTNPVKATNEKIPRGISDLP